MTYTELLADKVRTALAGVRRIEEKKMFGGTAFMVNEKMCVTVGHDRLMCRIDPESHETAIQRKGTSTVQMKGREYIGYVYVDKEGLASTRDVNYWLKLSLEFNKKAKSSRRQKKKQSSKR